MRQSKLGLRLHQLEARRPWRERTVPQTVLVRVMIVDADCKPIHAIEYQGGGRFKGAHATAARDEVKKEALRRAGIGYVDLVLSP